MANLPARARAANSAQAEVTRSAASPAGVPVTLLTPTLVRDINPGGDSQLSELTVVGDSIYFAATDGVHGTELWISDGSHDGTHQVRDLVPGSQGSKPLGLTAVGDRVYFSATDAAHGRELWVSDGSYSGTHRVLDVRPGSKSSYPNDITAMDGRAWFVANDGSHGRELWVSNGTAGGTHLFKDIAPDPAASSPAPAELTAMNDELWFADGGHVWFTDGTLGGTHRLLPKLGNFQVAVDLTPMNGRMYFFVGVFEGGCAGSTDTFLYRSDGTAAGTRPLTGRLRTDVYGGVRSLIVNAGKLYFVAPDANYHSRIWRSDGTVGGTTMIAPKGFDGQMDGDLYAAGGLLFFTTNHQQQLWSTDGQSYGEHLLKDGTATNWSAYADYGGAGVLFAAFGDRVYFAGGTEAQGTLLWSTQGTAASTRPETGTGPGHVRDIRWLTPLGSSILFRGNDGSGNQLWSVTP